MSKQAWILSLLVLALLGLAACGGGEKSQEKAASAGDPEAGKQVYLNEGTCGTCHTIEGVEGASGQVGADHTHIATRAAELAKEVGVGSAEEFIRQSILEPDAYISKECPTGPCVAGLMPKDFGSRLTEKQINDLVAFLMQQK